MQLQFQYGNTPSRSMIQGTVVVLKPLRQSKAVSSPDLKPGGMCPVRQLRRQNGWSRQPWRRRVGGSFAPRSLVPLSCDRKVRDEA